MNRFIPLGILVFWLMSVSWLVRHDVVPALTARDVPRYAPGAWLTDRIAQSQARIENRYGHRVGTVWTRYVKAAENLSRYDTLWLERIAYLPPIRIDVESDFAQDGALDEFSLAIHGAGEPIRLLGERFGDQFGFQLLVGASPRQLFTLSGSEAGLVADAFRPFPTLPNLEVGQSWRMQVVNPLAVVSGVGSKMIPMLVQVTGKERLITDDGAAECFVVETDGARAWVKGDGVVLKQEVELPLGGRFTIIDEPFEEERLARVRAASQAAD
jgi:hypothetical protein